MLKAMKTKISRVLVAAGCAAGITATATAAIASPPVPPTQCQAARDTRLFNAGVLKGESLVNQAWNAPSVNHDCDKMDLLKQLVLSTFHVAPPPGSPLGGVCQGLGMEAGAVARINDIGTVCEKACTADGSYIGQLAALLYCQLSEALGGLGLDVNLTEPALDTCGTDFELACVNHFDAQVQVDTLCDPFTVAPFTAVFTQARKNQCLYDPQP